MNRAVAFALAFCLGCAGQKDEWHISVGAAPGRSLASPARGDTLHFQAHETHRAATGATNVVSSVDSPNYFEWSSSAPEQAEFLSPGILYLRSAGTMTITVRTNNAERRVVLTVGVKPTVIICSETGGCKTGG